MCSRGGAGWQARPCGSSWPSDCLFCSLWTRISYDPWSSQVVENVTLFAPAGFAWNLLRRRGLIVWIGLTGMSLLIGTIQGLTGLDAPDVADLLANAAAGGANARAGLLRVQQIGGAANGDRAVRRDRHLPGQAFRGVVGICLHRVGEQTLRGDVRP